VISPTVDEQNVVSKGRTLEDIEGLLVKQPEAHHLNPSTGMVTVVIPTLNEKDAIGPVIDELRKEGFYNILVVDGYSKDGTPEVAKTRGAMVLQQVGPGKAGALATAARYVDTPFMLIMDGDGTYPAGDAHRLLKHADSYDEVIGARTSGRGNIPLVNRFGNWLISKTFKLMFDVPITDVLSGMYLVRTERIRKMNISSTSFDIEVEIASKIASTGRIAQVPINYRERIGQQKLRRSDGVKILSTLFWMAYYNNPLLLFGAIASLTAIPAVGILGYTIYSSVYLHVWHSAYALFGGMLLLFAIEAGTISLWSLLTKRSESRILIEIRSMKEGI
jgi:dolichol-phosphate hexosyltransferase